MDWDLLLIPYCFKPQVVKVSYTEFLSKNAIEVRVLILAQRGHETDGCSGSAGVSVMPYHIGRCLSWLPLTTSEVFIKRSTSVTPS